MYRCCIHSQNGNVETQGTLSRELYSMFLDLVKTFEYHASFYGKSSEKKVYSGRLESLHTNFCFQHQQNRSHHYQPR